MALILQLQLKQKIQLVSDYTTEPFTSEEALELDSVANDKEAALDERIIAARALLNIAENRLTRAQRQVNYFSNIHSKLVHEKEYGKHLDSTAKKIEDTIGSSPDVLAALEALLEWKRNK